MLAGGLAVGAVITAWAGAGALQLGSDSLPAVAVEQANGPDANRLVVLTPAADRLDFAVIGNEPGDLMRDVERPADVTDPGARAAARHDRLRGRRSRAAPVTHSPTSASGSSRSRRRQTTRSRVRLDAAQGLTRLGSTADQTLWRVVARPSAVAADVPVPPSRVRLDDAENRPLQVVPVDGPHGAVSAGPLRG